MVPRRLDPFRGHSLPEVFTPPRPPPAAAAVFSPCGGYRWWLQRTWQPERPTLVFVGLNPSCADGQRDDPTLRRLVAYGRRWGFGRLEVINLFGAVATTPAALKRMADPVGTDNEAWIRRCLERLGPWRSEAIPARESAGAVPVGPLGSLLWLGKTINFGVIYGMGAQRLAREAGLPQAQAKEFLSRYKQRYPKVFAYLELQERLALSLGYVETILGRRRPFHFDPGGLGRLLGKDPLTIDLEAARRGGMEGQQLRAAANAPIQGSSADIIKLAMVHLHRTLRDQGLPARLLLQVHDELVLEVAPEALEAVRDLTRHTMEEAVLLRVPLKVEAGVGPNWMEAK